MTLTWLASPGFGCWVLFDKIISTNILIIILITGYTLTWDLCYLIRFGFIYDRIMLLQFLFGRWRLSLFKVISIAIFFEVLSVVFLLTWTGLFFTFLNERLDIVIGSDLFIKFFRLVLDFIGWFFVPNYYVWRLNFDIPIALVQNGYLLLLKVIYIVAKAVFIFQVLGEGVILFGYLLALKFDLPESP